VSQCFKNCIFRDSYLKSATPENPYLQYFIGIESYSSEEPFEASTMVNFRKRIGMELTNKINKEMVKKVEGVEKKKKKMKVSYC
jgi:hypothetical protein